MKKLVIAAVTAAALPTIATLPATAQPAHAHRAAAPAGQLDMSAVPKLNSEQIRQVQEALQARGFDPGPVDGVLGPRTQQAVRHYQDRYGIKASGNIDNQTLYALGATELAGQPGSEPERD
jgi:peptidoglycan hydrolase-like protein with peptidoglycan-binding domain